MSDTASDLPESPNVIPPPPSADDALSRSQLLLYALAFEGGQIVVAGLGAWLCGVPLWETLRWEWAALGRGLALTAPLLVLFLLLQRWSVGPLERIRRFLDEVVRPMFAPLTMVDLALISVLAGLGEELIFRGFLQPWLAGWIGDWGGLALASLLFGLCHLITPTYALLAALVGVYFGAAFLFTGNLLDVIIAHAVYDFVVLVWVRRQR